MQFINLNKCTFCTGWEDLNCYLAGTYKSRIRLSSDLDFLFFDIVKNYIFKKTNFFNFCQGTCQPNIMFLNTFFAWDPNTILGNNSTQHLF
jgi:hypothetical protein